MKTESAGWSEKFREAVANHVRLRMECSFAWLVDAEERLTIVEMLGLDGDSQRYTVRNQALKTGAVLVCHAIELWHVDLERDDPRQAEADEAAANGELDKLPYVKEVVRIYEESGAGLSVSQAQILRTKERASLGPWVALKTDFPRPNFRRYLAEQRGCA